MQNKIYETIKTSVDSGSTSGVNVLVLKNGKEAAYCEYGFRDLENRIPMTRDTIFRLYSQTKPVTAAAAVLLVSQGKLDIAEELSEYMPEFSEQYINTDGNRVPVKSRILVRDLLNMTSGIPYPGEGSESEKQSGKVFWETVQRLRSDDPVTTREFAEKMSKNDLLFEPGSYFMYGASADILGCLIERVSGMCFGDFLKKYFFEPLEMNDTSFYIPPEKSHRLAKVYNYNENGSLYEMPTDHLGLVYERDIPPAFESGGAGLCSTLDDYGKFGTMLLGGGRYNGREIMPEAAVKYLTENCLDISKCGILHDWWKWMSGYSYGCLMRKCVNVNETPLFSEKGEYGWDGWLGTFFSNEPSKGITLLLGAQQAGIGKVGMLTRKIKNIVMSCL